VDDTALRDLCAAIVLRAIQDLHSSSPELRRAARLFLASEWAIDLADELRVDLPTLVKAAMRLDHTPRRGRMKKPRRRSQRPEARAQVILHPG
jgi:hypothetical protein